MFATPADMRWISTRAESGSAGRLRRTLTRMETTLRCAEERRRRAGKGGRKTAHCCSTPGSCPPPYIHTMPSCPSATPRRWASTFSSAATSTCFASWPSAAYWRTCCLRYVLYIASTCWVCVGSGETHAVPQVGHLNRLQYPTPCPHFPYTARPLQDHTHTFVNLDGDVRELDFRFFLNGLKIGAPFHGRCGDVFEEGGEDGPWGEEDGGRKLR